jgi:hypothetical protein
MRGTALLNGTDYSGFQFEMTMILLFILFFTMSFWVFYDSDRYFDGRKRHLFWPLTLFTGPIGLGFYFFMRRKTDY